MTAIINRPGCVQECLVLAEPPAVVVVPLQLQLRPPLSSSKMENTEDKRQTDVVGSSSVIYHHPVDILQCD